MSINQEFGNRRYRSSIVPSARRSIHSDQYRGMYVPDMTRYESSGSSDEELSVLDPGVDEVDNVMSKFLHTSSPIDVRRRNSLTNATVHYEDDSDECNVLAKSLPATLSPSNYSDDFACWGAQHAHNKRLNTSDSTSCSDGNTSNTSLYLSVGSQNISNRINQSRSPNVSHKINPWNRGLKKPEGTLVKCVLLGLMMAILLPYFCDFLSTTLKSPHPQPTYDEVRFYSELNELGAKYKVNDNSILQLKTGISTIFKNQDTSCVIFLYNSQKSDFNASNFDGFVNNVVSNAAKFLRDDTTPVEHRVVEGSELVMRSHTQLVQAYQDDISKAGVLLVRDVARVPSPLAMAFHYYCDEYQPLVRKSAIFFTMNKAKCHNSDEKSSHAYVEKCLKEKWNTVPKDNIGPLLTRLVSIVVDVSSGE